VSDIVFTDARIVDGTGAPSFRGHVSVRGGRIERVTRGSAPDGDEVVDLDGAVLAPGFVEAHSHSDFEVFAEPTLTPKLHQGITTEVVGQDGLGAAPVSADDADEWSARVQTLSGSVDSAPTFETVEAYLDAVDDADPALNLGMLAGHGTIRFEAMGMAGRTATDEELDEMRALLRESLDDGCLGLSTGLIYHPQIHSDTAELRALCEVLAGTDRPFVAHIRSEGHWLFEAMYEFVSVGYETGVPLHLSHFKLSGQKQHGKADLALAFLEIAREMGVDVTADQYPYVAGSTSLSAVLPPWVHGDGAEQTLERLRDPDSRARIAADVEEFRIPFWENDAGTVGWENIRVCDVGSGDPDVEGKTITEIAADRDADPLDTCLDLLVEEELDARIVIFLGSQADVERLFQSPLICVGSDGLVSENPHPRLYGTYPKIIDEFVREKNLVSLEEAVRKMTSLPARVYGLQSKGVLREGLDADLVSFRPEWVGTESSYDDPKRLPTGIDHVVVDGEFVLRDGEQTGNRPGSTLRA
jgi:N-acyl-D-amino-acid deacylase